MAVVTADPSIRLEELFLKTDAVASRDDIYQLIATGELYVDLSAAPIVEPHQVRIFPNRETAVAYAHIVEVSPIAVANNPRFIDLAVGSGVEWNNRAWKIANVGDKMVSLLGENNAFTELPLAAFELLVKEGRVNGVFTRAGSWLILLTDAYSRRILAIYVTFDPPSYRSCMMILRQCVKLHGRLPLIVVVDGGPEFKSAYFDTLLARYECTKKTRPPAKARFGSICERLFGTTNTQLIHNLRGNTQITRNVRQVTKSVNPKGMATWPLGNLYDRLCEYAYQVYDMIAHPALGETPRAAFIEGIARTGRRPHRYIPYDDDFLMWTLPTTPKGTAKMLAGRGVKIHHIFYWSDAFRDPEIENTQVSVRYDPFEVGIAYAFVGKRWVRCYSEYYSVFHGRSEKELMIATKELRALKNSHSQQFTVTAKKLADFLESVEAEEVMLVQRLRDAEGRKVIEKINGGSPAAHVEEVPLDRVVQGNDDTPPEETSPTEDEAEMLEIYEEF